MSPSGCWGCRAVWRPRTGLKSRNAWKKCPHHHQHPSCAGFHQSPGLFQTPDNTKTQVSVINKSWKTHIPQYVFIFSATSSNFLRKAHEVVTAESRRDLWLVAGRLSVAIMACPSSSSSNKSHSQHQVEEPFFKGSLCFVLSLSCPLLLLLLVICVTYIYLCLTTFLRYVAAKKILNELMKNKC